MMNNERFVQVYLMPPVPEMVGGRKVYRPNAGSEHSSLMFGIGFLVMLLLVPFIGVFAEYRKTGDMSGPWVGIMIFLGVLIAAAVVRSVRPSQTPLLAVGDDGLEYQRGSHVLAARWDDVVKLRYDDEPVLIVRAGTTPNRNALQTERISLLPFGYSDDSELARDLRTHAPHLFS